MFTRTKHGADKLVRYLETGGLSATAIHGNKSQGQRERALAAFKDGKVQTLVATDIAARGIDVDGVTHVFQFELPNVPEAYVHRIGRTARAGAEGIAIAFCDVTERGLLRDIEKITRQTIPSEDRRLDQSRPMPEGRPEHERAAKQASRRRGRGKPVDHAHRPEGAQAKTQHRKGGRPQGAPHGAQAKPQGGMAAKWTPMDGERPAAQPKAAARPAGGGYGQRPAGGGGNGGGYRGPRRQPA